MTSYYCSPLDQQHIYKRIHFHDFLRNGQRSLEFVSDAGFWGRTVIAKTRLIASCPQILYSNVLFQKISRILPCNVFSFAIFLALYNPLKNFLLQSFPPLSEIPVTIFGWVIFHKMHCRIMAVLSFNVFQLLNELELYCKMKDGGSVTEESWEKNWTSLLVKVKDCFQSCELDPG